MVLSVRFKEAIKTALAMAIAIGIALAMDWDKPVWAGFAVALIGLSTAGESINKGAMRMLGTLVGAVASLTIIGVFPQDRWAYIALLSIFLGFCTYMLTGTKRQYFWQITAVVTVLIGVTAATNQADAFNVAVLRSQETGLGVLVYSLVSVILWRQSSADAFFDVTEKLFGIQLRLFSLYRGLMSGEGDAGESQSLKMQGAQLLLRQGPAYNGAESDTYEVWEVRRDWRRWLALSRELVLVLERWRETFPEIRSLDLNTVWPNKSAMFDEIETRFEQTGRMLAGEAPTQLPQAIELSEDATETRSLNHFEKAALALTKTQIDRLEALSRELFDCAARIKDFSAVSSNSTWDAPATQPYLDIDRIAAAARIMATVWIAFLIWIYIDPPGHETFIQLSIAFGLMLITVPQMPATALLVPFASGAVVSGLIYVFIMPNLSNYAEFGLLIFVFTFTVNYVFWQPLQGLKKSAAMITFLMMIPIANQQTYSFAGLANSTMMLLLVIFLLVGLSYLPLSSRREKVFLRLMQRFFRHGAFAMEHVGLDRYETQGLGTRAKIRFYKDDLLELPQKLRPFGRQIDYRLLPDDTPEQVDALIPSLQALALRIEEVLNTRQLPVNDWFVEKFFDDARAWRLAIIDILRGWATDPAKLAISDLEERLEQRLTRMDKEIQETIATAPEGTVSEQDFESFYRVLGAFRSLSEAIVTHATLARQIDWARWQEARF